jgi:hypothetical protein
MVTENVLSASFTNRDATPSVKTNSILKGRCQSAVGIVSCGTGDLASTYRFFSLPSNALVKQLLIYSPDMGTTGLADIGLYDTTANGGLVVDADFFASALDMKTAALNGLDVTHESGVFSIANSEKPLWLALGLSVDPCKEYDVVMTTTEAFQAAGVVKLAAEFMI